MDLDKISDRLSTFENSYANIFNTKIDLQEKIEEMKYTIGRYELSLTSSKENNKQILETVADLQKTVIQKRDYREKNKLLSDEIKSRKHQAENQRDVLNRRVSELENSIQELKEKNSDELFRANELSKQKLLNMEIKTSAKIQTLERSLAEERKKMTDLQQEKNSEIGRITMQYENKLSQLRSQQMKLQHKTQPTVLGNEIFRRKLQHVQEESAQKEAMYKNRIKELENKLSTKENIQPKTSNLMTNGVPDYSNHLNNYLSKNRGNAIKRKTV